MYTPERKTQKGQVLVSDRAKYKKITNESPFGLKCILINKAAGVAYLGILSRKDKFADYYSPMPTFEE